MKLKKALALAFFILTFVPIVIVSLLLYKSGFDLSKESYIRNMVESIHVQSNYISQTIENDMIADYRFANRNYGASHKDLLAAFQSYLAATGDKITVCMLLNSDDVPLYTIGEETVLANIQSQLPSLPEQSDQAVLEFDLGDNSYSLGIVTPIYNSQQKYEGCMISIYNKSFISKIISSYYEISDTSTYICRSNGTLINYRSLEDSVSNALTNQTFQNITQNSQGMLNTELDGTSVSGYYQQIHNTPWYLTGFVDHKLIYSFTNHFVLVYLLIILIIFIADMILSISFSRRVVTPINNLIAMMEGYKNSRNSKDLQYESKGGYQETRYLHSKFISLMQAIVLTQHNFEGIYQLYQSSTMDDTNIDIDVAEQTIHSNKSAFEALMTQIALDPKACIIERFTHCFCENDQRLLTDIFERMRDEHLSVTCEAEVYTSYFNEKWFHCLVVPMYENDRLSRLFIQLRDISSYKRQEQMSSERARRDVLTGLYNRDGFTECAAQRIQESDPQQSHGLLFLDMNDFKLVNDNLGHRAGDDLLRSIGAALLSAAGPNDVVARYGGDEFAIFMPNTTLESARAQKEKLNRLLVYPFVNHSISFTVTASIGLSLFCPASKETLDQVMQQADAAMYETKRIYKKQH